MIGSHLKIIADIDCSMYIDGEFILALIANRYYKIPIKKGSYDLRFISTEEENISYEEVYTMIDNETEDLKHIQLKNNLYEYKKNQERLRHLYTRLGKDSQWEIVHEYTDETIVLSKLYTYVNSYYENNFCRVMQGGDLERDWDGTPLLNEEGCVMPNNKGKWGFINSYGQEIIPCKYYDSTNFMGEIAFVKNEKNKWGAINHKDETIIDFMYDHVLYIWEECFAVNIGGQHNGYIDKFSGGEYEWLEGGKSGLISSKGEELTPLKFRRIELSHPIQVYISNHKEPFIISSENGKFILNNNGEKLFLPDGYDCGYDYHDGLAKVEKDSKFGFIDISGNEIIPCIYDDAQDFYNGFTLVVKKDILSPKRILDTSGNEIFEYSDIMFYRNGIICISEMQPGPVNLYTPTKECLTKGKYDYIELFETDCLSYQFLKVMSEDSLYGIIDFKGHEIIPPTYDYIDDNLISGIGLLLHTKLNGKYGMINLNNQKAIPCEFDKIELFQHRRFIGFKVWKKSLCGLYTNNGNIILNTIYDEINNFIDDTLRIQYQGKYGLVNFEGKEIVKSIYDSIDQINVENLVEVQYHGKYGLIDINGNKIIDIEYDYLEEVSGCGIKSNAVYVKRNSKIGVIDSCGNFILPCEYDSINYNYNLSLYCTYKNGIEEVFNYEGKKDINTVMYVHRNK